MAFMKFNSVIRHVTPTSVLQMVPILICLLISCDGNYKFLSASRPTENYLNKTGLTVESRIICPYGYNRLPADSSSYTFFLRQLPLKPFDTDVEYFNGEAKNKFIHVAVIDMPVGNSDLQQCADSGIRLYAEYLYYADRHKEIHFNFTNGEKCSWIKYAEGWRINVSGNKTEWFKATESDYSYGNFSEYLDLVFMYAGSYSLSKEMKFVPVDEIMPGDMLVHPGFPGHVEIVMDVCVHAETGEKLFLLAQGFTPAQDIELLKNESEPELSPWYSLKTETIETPQAVFNKNELMRFK